MSTASYVAFVAAVFVLAGLVKGVIGLGLPTVAIGLLGLIMPPGEAAVLLVVPSLVTNVGQLMTGPALVELATRLWPMLLALAAGTLAGVGLLTGPGSTGALAALGAILVVYGAVGLAQIRLSIPARVEGWAGPAVGVLTGFVGGCTGVFTVPGVPYVAALGLERDSLVQALGLYFTVGTVALAAGLLWYGAMPLGAASNSALAVGPALVGLAAGSWLRTRVRPSVFRICFFAGLVVLGAELLWRGVSTY